MALMNIALVYRVVTIDTAEKTIITPLGFEKPFTVQGDSVSDAYLEQMASYFSSHLLTFQKSNALSNFESVLRYVDPLVYNEMRARFLLDVDRIERNNIASVFHRTKMRMRDSTVYLTGEHIGMIGESVVSRGEKTFAMAFAYDGSNLSITAFNEVRLTPTGGYDVVDPYKEVLISTGSDASNPLTPSGGTPEATDANN